MSIARMANLSASLVLLIAPLGCYGGFLGEAPWETAEYIPCRHAVSEYGGNREEDVVLGEMFLVTSQDGKATTFSTNSEPRVEATSPAGTISANSLSSSPSTQALSSPVSSASSKDDSVFSSTTPTPSDLNPTRFTARATAGISVGTSMGLLLVAACLFFLIRRKRKRARAAQAEALTNDGDHEKPELETRAAHGDDAKSRPEHSKTDHELEPSQAEQADRCRNFMSEAPNDQRWTVHELGSEIMHEMRDASKQS